MRHLVYLHGFASSPQSSKACFLADRFRAYDLTLHCPDLNQPDFSTLTTTRMIDRVNDELRNLAEGPVVLIGSSLGAFVALHLVEQLLVRGVSTHPVERLILLAPAFDFGRAGMKDLGEHGLVSWQQNGWLNVPHYAYAETRPVHYELYADAARYDSFAAHSTSPTLIVHGRHDEVVDPVTVETFAAPRPHVRLVMVDDGHQLSGSLDRVWSETASFLDLDNRR